MRGGLSWRKFKSFRKREFANSIHRMYSFATGSGVSIGIIVGGVITLNNSWRFIYYVGAVMIGILLILIIFTFPETAYNRVYDEASEKGDIYENKQNPYRLSISIIMDDYEKAAIRRYYLDDGEKADMAQEEVTGITPMQHMEERIRRLEDVVLGKTNYKALPRGALPPGSRGEKSYWRKMALFSSETFTSESLWKSMQPFHLFALLSSHSYS